MSIGPQEQDLVFLVGVNSPPLSRETRREVGFQLRQVQQGEFLPLPLSRPMPSIGAGVHELRLSDEAGEWRVIYRVGEEEIVVVDIFEKATRRTPPHVIGRCRDRLAAFDAL